MKIIDLKVFVIKREDVNKSVNQNSLTIISESIK